MVESQLLLLECKLYLATSYLQTQKHFFFTACLISDYTRLKYYFQMLSWFSLIFGQNMVGYW